MSSKIFRRSHRNGGEGNGNLLQYSCLENPMEGGAWSAAVHGAAKSRTQLTRLSSSRSIETGFLKLSWAL